MKKNWIAGIAVAGLLATGCEQAFVEVTDGIDNNSQVGPTGIERNVGPARSSSGPGAIGDSSVQILPIVPQVSVPIIATNGLRLIYAHTRNAPAMGELDAAVIGNAFEARLEATDVQINRVEWYIDGLLFRDDDISAPYNIRYTGVLPLADEFDSDQNHDHSWTFTPGRVYSIVAHVYRDGGVSIVEASFSIGSDGAPALVPTTTTTARPATTTVAPTTTARPATTTVAPTTTARPATTTVAPTTTTAAPVSADGRPIVMANANTVLNQANTIYDFNFSSPGEVVIAASNVEARNIRGSGARRIGVRNGVSISDSGFRNFEFSFAHVQMSGGATITRPYFIDGVDVNAQPNVGEGDIMQLFAYEGDIVDPLIDNVTIYGKQRPAGSSSHNDGIQFTAMSGGKVWNPTIRNSHIEGASSAGIQAKHVHGLFTLEGNTLSERFESYHAVIAKPGDTTSQMLFRNNTMVGGASVAATNGWSVAPGSNGVGGNVTIN